MTKRKKWEPAALMILVLALGMWIAFGPAGKPKFPIAPDSLTQTVRIGNDRGTLEAFKASPGDADYTFRLWMKDIEGTPDSHPRAQAVRLYGARAVRNTLETNRNWIFRTLNITSWTSVVWVGIGLLGQLAFSGRMILQWIVSEKKRQSIITESFWWFSLFGAVTLFSYFVWRQDPIGILGQASGIVIYMRNLRLIYKHKRRMARSQAQALAAASAHRHDGEHPAPEIKPRQTVEPKPEPASV